MLNIIAVLLQGVGRPLRTLFTQYGSNTTLKLNYKVYVVVTTEGCMFEISVYKTLRPERVMNNVHKNVERALHD